MEVRDWKAQDPTYSYQPSKADTLCKPCEIIKSFLDILAFENLVKYTVNYAVQNGNHIFILTSDEMKTLIGIMLVSGYSCVP